MSDQNFWSLLSRNSKYKYRELLKEESQNDELTNHLRETFAESADNLKQRIRHVAFGFGRDREVIPNKKSQMSESKFTSMFNDVSLR